ncbi:MAG: ATPase [Acidimicrobiia bacterium]|nr:ATPase [Acidimicrobiia bacterium]
MSRYYLGVDGGQSSTTALIGGDDGNVLGMGRSGPCNHVSGAERRTKFLRVLTECVSAACTAAGLSAGHKEFEAACLGFSGGAADKRDLVEEHFHCRRLSVTHDALIALAGATAGSPGIITIAGTGSMAFGRNTQGQTARAGGWGYIFGDEGGGFDLARQALRAALRAEEGWGPPTTLHSKLLQATGAANANDLLHRFYTPDYSRPQIAALSKLVEEAAREGDSQANDILQAAAQQLALLAAAVRRQLFSECERVSVAWIGGVFSCDALRERFRLLLELDDGVQCGPPQMAPAAGALLEAYRSAELAVTLKNCPEMEK